MILKIFGEIFGVFAETIACCFSKKLTITLFFRKSHFFRRKLAKIAEKF
jgi:hypothetical protein